MLSILPTFRKASNPSTSTNQPTVSTNQPIVHTNQPSTHIDQPSAPVNKLPDLPSALLHKAHDALATAEIDPLYKIDMGVWHSPNPSENKCRVCLAGAVMAMNLDAKFMEPIGPRAYPLRVAEKLVALDNALYSINHLLVRLGYREETRQHCLENMTVHYLGSYQEYPNLFKQRLLQAANELAQLGH